MTPGRRRRRVPLLDAVLDALQPALAPELSDSWAGVYARDATTCPSCHARLDVAVRLKYGTPSCPVDRHLTAGAVTRCPACGRVLVIEEACSPAAAPGGLVLRAVPRSAVEPSAIELAWLRAVVL